MVNNLPSSRLLCVLFFWLIFPCLSFEGWFLYQYLFKLFFFFILSTSANGLIAR